MDSARTGDARRVDDCHRCAEHAVLLYVTIAQRRGRFTRRGGALPLSRDGTRVPARGDIPRDGDRADLGQDRHASCDRYDRTALNYFVTREMAEDDSSRRQGVFD